MQLPGIGIFGGQEAVINILVPYLRGKGFRVEAFWALTLHGEASYLAWPSKLSL